LIVSGWEKPIGLTDNGVVASIEKNLQSGLNYTFLYPHSSTHPKFQNDQDYPEQEIAKWIRDLRRKIVAAWHTNQANIPDDSESDFVKQLEGFQSELLTRITCKQTIQETNFWLLIPSNYCVLYNLGEEVNEKYKYGTFLTKGMLVRSDQEISIGNKNIIDSVESYGWLHMSKEKYKMIEESYLKSIE
jgi:hypothetical protein